MHYKVYYAAAQEINVRLQRLSVFESSVQTLCRALPKWEIKPEEHVSMSKGLADTVTTLEYIPMKVSVASFSAALRPGGNGMILEVSMHGSLSDTQRDDAQRRYSEYDIHGLVLIVGSG